MKRSRCLFLLPLAVFGCGPAEQAGAPNASVASVGDPQAALSPAEQALVDGGGLRKDVLAARALVAPFTRTDQSRCFGNAALKGAAMAAGGGSGEPALTRVAIAIDGSGSMAGRIGDRSKLELARAAISSFVDGLPAGVPASLAVFGQQGDNRDSGKARSCAGIDLLAPMSADRAGLRTAIAGVRAVGWTPLAAGLAAARQQLGPSSIPGEQVVYVVSDGIETCGGDPVAVARAINRGSTRAVVNIIGFGLPGSEAAALQSVASAGGGRFVNVTDDNGFERELAEQMRRNRNRTVARLAQDGNRIATGAASTDLTQCTGAIIQSEARDTLAAYDARAGQGEALPPRYQVVALLRERQTALEAARDAHATRQGQARDAANAGVDAQEKGAR